MQEAQRHEEIGDEVLDRRFQLIGKQIPVGDGRGLQHQLVHCHIGGEDQAVRRLERVIRFLESGHRFLVVARRNRTSRQRTHQQRGEEEARRF